MKIELNPPKEDFFFLYKQTPPSVKTMPFPAGGYESAIGHCPAPCHLHPVPLASNGSQTLEWIGTGESDF